MGIENAFLEPLSRLSVFDEIRTTLERDEGGILVRGCLDSQKANLLYGLSDLSDWRLVLCHDEKSAKQFFEDYRFYDRNTWLYPAKDLLFFKADLHGNMILRQRMRVIKALLEIRQGTVVTSIDACLDFLTPLNAIREKVLRIGRETVVEMDALRIVLTRLGYEYVSQVEMPGQFSVRGGIVDIYALTEDNPWRVELFGDEVDSIRSFDAASQRSMEELEEVVIYPASEYMLSADDSGKSVSGETFPDYFAKDTILILDEPNRLAQSGAQVVEEFRLSCERRAQKAKNAAYEEMISRREMGLESRILEEAKEEGEALKKAPGEGEASMEAPEEGEVSMKAPEEGEAYDPFSQIISFEELQIRLKQRRTVSLCYLEPARGGWDFAFSFTIKANPVTHYKGSLEALTKDLQEYREDGYRMVLLSGSRTRAERLAKELGESGLSAFWTDQFTRTLQAGEIMVAYGHAHNGFAYPDAHFALLTETDIFGKERARQKRRREVSGQDIQSFNDLAVGDYVVHEQHGIGIYRGIENIVVEGVAKDYIKIEYKNGGELCILATQLDSLQKYSSAGTDSPPKLNTIGTADWGKTRSRVRKAVRNIAKELVELYAARTKKDGYVCGPDTVWQREFEELFPYEETPDQLNAIEDTKRDMESTKIMDRLICGDVGYGKTEIALRAAFKEIQESRQVAYLVPTTILAQQHYNTFVQRMKDFPVKVGLLCRFSTPAQQRETLAGLRRGEVDVVIGTHRLLSKDVDFKNLGLLIIDEEQRFGVTHKEKIKQMRRDIDVLTLTATPIPRTLHMSLIGIRDMSLLEEAPMDRVPIQTYVMEYDEETVREAISRELRRDGQVFYVYNRVQSIEQIAARIGQLVPEARVGYAHGQMSERELEKVMVRFVNGELDVLVSTTIIETGLDISNVNTMIVHDSDRFGLSQLYQLRGRIGRSNRTAYAFMMYRKDKLLKEKAEERLAAIAQYTDLGSGFKIAMRDLELRGAGDLLGAEQSGHMELVGYDLYCKMLSQAVQEVKEGRPVSGFETTIDISLDAFIPEYYIRNEYQKLDAYKRIAGITSKKESDDMYDELLDRYGDPPKSVQNLLSVALLKALAHNAYVTEIRQNGDEIRFGLYEQAKIDQKGFVKMIERSHKRLRYMTYRQKPSLIYRVSSSLLPEIMGVVAELNSLVLPS